MSAASHLTQAHSSDGHHEDSTMVFGFWVYILSDLILFATLFATYIVFASSYNGGPHGSTLVEGKKLFDLPYVLIETFILLFSSITYGFAMVRTHRDSIRGVKFWLAITALLGICFVGMEINEFHHLVSVLHDHVLNPSGVISAYFSAFFCLVGTHGLHVSLGILWMLFMFVQLNRSGLSAENRTRLACLSIFWHFLDIVWVGVFTVVYLMGVL